jgi:hypothetical protein
MKRGGKKAQHMMPDGTMMDNDKMKGGVVPLLVRRYNRVIEFLTQRMEDEDIQPEILFQVYNAVPRNNDGRAVNVTQAHLDAIRAYLQPLLSENHMSDLDDILNGVVGGMKGGRAVPSSGLSQFKGGSNGCIVGGGKGSDSDSESCSSSGSDSDMEGGARDMEIMARESAPRPVIRAGLSDQHSAEAKEMGRHLGRHLMAVRGGGFFDLFTKGIVEAGQQGESFAKETGMPNANPLPLPPPSASPMPDAGADMPPPPPPTGGAVFHRRRDMLGEKEEAHEEHTARRFGRTRKSGAGAFSDFAAMLKKKNNHPTISSKSVAEKGGYLSGSYEGMGMGEECGGSRSGGARATRAAIVKKVMAEKGLKLGEASKYVKEHGLYKGGASSPTGCGGTRSETKPKRKEKNPYGRTHTSELSLGKVKKVKKPAPAPAPAQPDVGLALDLPPPPVGRGKGRRASAGPNDGRRKRAEIVKKVMAEKGCSMIEASKYVKAHNLY